MVGRSVRQTQAGPAPVLARAGGLCLVLPATLVAGHPLCLLLPATLVAGLPAGLQRAIRVVALLLEYVAADKGNIALPYREGAIAGLPAETGMIRKSLVNPFR